MPASHVLLKKFKKMKTLPHVAINLIQLISNEETTIHELEKVFKLDPILILRLLRLVNSSYYGLLEKVDTISGAIAYLGMDTLRNLIIVEALKDIFKTADTEDVFSRKQLWFHCSLIAIVCQMISERIFDKEGDDAFLCGILHDAGMIVEDQVEGELLLETCKAYEPNGQAITEYEEEFIGTNHCKVGRLLAREWKLPVEVQDGIRRHHSVISDMPPWSLSGIIQISEYLVAKIDANYTALPNMSVTLSQSLLQHIQENIKEYRVLLKELPEELATAKEIYRYSEESV